MKRIRYMTLVIIIILINIGCDQSTKNYARNNFKDQGTIKVIDNFIVIHYAENNGGFLSLGSNIPQPYKNILLLFFPIIAIVVSIVFIIKSKHLSFIEILFACGIIGGGLSNVFDRIAYNGWVTDFLNFGIGNIRTGILNFADISITFGALFLVITQYMKKNKKGLRHWGI